MELLILFSSSLLAATILPAQSEAVLVALYLMGNYSPALLITVATFGNVLGACINWLLGRYLNNFKSRRWFPVKEAALEKATNTYKKYGVWSLLLSWVPIIGDPLTVIAGLLHTPFFLFLFLVTLGKLVRYVIVLSIV